MKNTGTQPIIGTLRSVGAKDREYVKKCGECAGTLIVEKWEFSKDPPRDVRGHEVSGLGTVQEVLDNWPDGTRVEFTREALDTLVKAARIEMREAIAAIPNDATTPDGEMAVSEYRDAVLRACGVGTR